MNDKELKLKLSAEEAIPPVQWSIIRNEITGLESRIGYVLANIRGGRTLGEAEIALEQCTNAAIITGREATLSVTLKIKSVGESEYQIKPQVTTKLPPRDESPVVFYKTPEGNLRAPEPTE